MKKIMFFTIMIAIIYLISSNFFINLIPPTEKELIGIYTSKYEDKQYELILTSDKVAKFKVIKNNNIIYTDECKIYHVEKIEYKIFPIYNLTFDNCEKMDSNTILERDIWFNILIGNNGSELKRIDPDANIYFKK